MNAEDILNRMVVCDIIVEPKLLWDLLYVYQESSSDSQIAILDRLLEICQRTLHNPLIFLNKTCHSTPDNTKVYILDFLVDLALSSSISDRLFDLISYLVYSCDLKQANTLHLLLSLPACSESQILLILRFFQLFLISPKMPPPYSYFYFNSKGSGLVMSPITYPFSKAISMCTWIRLESATGVSRLFTFHSKGSGGLEAYIVGTHLYYRTLGHEYFPPVKGSNGILLDTLPVQQWVCLAFEHQKAVFGRNQLKVVVNGIEVLSSMMDFPKINVVETTIASIGMDFFGQISCIMFFNEILTIEKMKNLYLHYNYGPHNNESLASIERFLVGSISKHLVLVFHPERINGNNAYSAVGNVVAKIQGITGSKSFTLRKNTSFGGTMMLLPILTRVVQLENAGLMEEWFRLVMMCLKERPDNQNEAVSAGFFKVLRVALEDTPGHMVTEEILNIIDDMKNSGTGKMPEQVFTNLIWNMKLWNKADANTQSHLFAALKGMYTKSKNLIKSVGIGEMLDNIQYLSSDKSINALVEIVEIALLYQEPGNTENFVKYLGRHPSSSIQGLLLSVIQTLITETGVLNSIFHKQVVEAKGIEICMWMARSENPNIKYLAVALLEKLISQGKIVFCQSTQEIFFYISSCFTVKSHSNDDSEILEDESFFNLAQLKSRSRRGSFTSPQARKEEQIYHTALELLLNRPIENNNILDDTDIIQSALGLHVFQSVLSKALPEIQHKSLQDQLMLTKFNKNNCYAFLSNPDWHIWLIDLLCNTRDDLDAADAVTDIAIRLHTTVLIQGMETLEAGVYLKRLLVWLEINKKCQRAKQVIRKLFAGFIAAAGKIFDFSEIFWRNLINFGYIVEEFVLYLDYSDSNEEILTWSKGWEDYGLCNSYLVLMQPIWNQSSGILTPEEFSRQIREIAQGKLKNEAGILNLQGEKDYKKRGKFGVVLFHLVCIGIKATEDSMDLEFWLSTLENLVKTIFFISESNKKTIVRQESKLYTLCVSYALGFLASAIPVHQSKMLLQDTLAKLLKYTFATFEINSTKHQGTGLKNFLKTSLTQYNYPCEDIVTFILQFNTGMEAWDNLILQLSLRQMHVWLDEEEEVKAALVNLYYKTREKFHSLKKNLEIAMGRAKIAEKHGQDQGNAAILTENCVARLNEYVKTVIQNVKIEQHAKMLEREMEKEYKFYKYSTLLREITQHFSVKTKESVSFAYKVQQTLCKDFSRPFVKPKSSKKKHTSSQKKPLKSEIWQKFIFEQIKRTPFSQDEEEDEFLIEIRKFSEESAKNSENFTATAGIVCPLAIKYGFIQLAYSKLKRTPKLIFRYDKALQEKHHSGIELFKFSPPFQIYAKTWKLSNLSNVFPKSYLMRPTAVELIFTDGKNILLNFLNMSDRMEFLIELQKLKRPLMNLKLSKPKSILKAVPASGYKAKVFADPGMTEKWANWQISNFEYLMYLNFCAGRSYNDLTQYPVMPWVISDYSSELIASSFRDFSKNMGSLGSPERVEIFADRYNNMVNDSTDLPFHFGSHYSNPAIALFYLMRLSPYDEGAQELQGGKFDLPDRLFNSVVDSYNSAIEDIADVREIVPEFFYLPEILKNINSLALGTSQSGEVVRDVKLPNWAKNAHDFIRIHREVLESDIASSAIHKWIDLIFGYKQQGIEAEKALNVFFYLTYENNVDMENVTDPQLATTLSTQIFHFGRTPTQLFSKPHIQKKAFSKIIDVHNVFSSPNSLKVFLSALSKSKASNVLSPRAIVKIKILNSRELFCIRHNRSITKFLFMRTLNEKSGLYFSLDPVQNIHISKEGLINSEDSSIFPYSPPFQFFQSCKALAYGGYWDGRIQLQKTFATDCVSLKFFHNATVTSLEISEDEKIAISGSRDGECVVWNIDIDIWLCKHSFSHHDEEVTSISISEDLHIFATTSLDGKCNIYSLSSCNLQKQIVLPENKPISLAKVSSAAPCKVILFSHEDRSIYSYSVNGELLNYIQEYCNLTAMVVTRYLTGEDFIISGSEKGDVWVRHAGTFEKVNSCSLGLTSPIASLATTSDFKHIIVGCADGELAILTT